MLWNASSINGFVVAASDGEAGIVKDFIFEDRDWTIQWLVVETGTWFADQHVFIPISSFGQPDPETRQFPLTMSMEQVGQCMGGDIYPLNDNGFTAHFEFGKKTAGSADMTAAHFRSLADITKAVVEATDGDVGHAEDFLIDSDLWLVKYLIVHTSSWWLSEKLLVSPRSIIGIDYARSIIDLDVTRQFVKDSPSYRPEQSVDGAFEETFNTYYGIRFGKK